MTASMEARWTVQKVRNTFIEYFCKKQGHKHVVSSSTIPHSDPTLLFANSGMNQVCAISLETSYLCEAHRLLLDSLNLFSKA
jgi:alanyl-tRNA synthetase